MISEQKEANLLLPFQILINQFDSELEITKATLTDWEKARSVSASGNDTANDELNKKIEKLEKGKRDVENFLDDLRSRLQSDTVDLDEMVNELQISRADFTLIFNETRSLLNYRYSTIQKNEINRRITAINASRMLNNADMAALQDLWTSILNMNNDKRLLASRKQFEDRLTDWEKLIAEKQTHAH